MAADWTVSLPSRGFTIGPGTDYRVNGDPGPRGFIGTAPVRTTDVALNAGHGDGLGRDTFAGRTLLLPVTIAGKGATDAERQADARSKLRTLQEAWRPVASTDTYNLGLTAPDVEGQLTGEIPLTTQFPGTPETTMTYFGRPRDVEEREWVWTQGFLRVLLTFRCHDPFVYGAEQYESNHLAALTIGPPAGYQVNLPSTGAAGQVTTRAWITVYGYSGGGFLAPTITEISSGATVEFSQVFSSLSHVALDLRTLTVYDPTNLPMAGGPDRTSWVTPDSPWFPVTCGSASIIMTDLAADGLTVAWLPAYL